MQHRVLWEGCPAALTWVLTGPSTGLSQGEEVVAQGLVLAWGHEPAVFLVPFPLPGFCGQEAAAQDRPVTGLAQGTGALWFGGVAVTLSGRTWLELFVSSVAQASLQPRQHWRQPPRLGTTAM